MEKGVGTTSDGRVLQKDHKMQEPLEEWEAWIQNSRMIILLVWQQLKTQE